MVEADRLDAAKPPVRSVEPGTILGRYELLAPIAEGGMASVWAARLHGHGGFSKIVALKMILPQLAGELEFQQMFLDEARIAARLRHPNVCETFDLGEDGGTLFIAMEWVDGVSLLRLIRLDKGGEPARPDASFRRAIEVRVAARIMADACAGLHAAHDLVDDDGKPLGVVHRDVSPHNFIVSTTGCVKVMDFGVAMAIGKSHATSTGEVKGKIAYMSPEQLKSLPVDRRSDVFALGCVLYEITTGRRPFRGSEARVVGAILKGRVEPPSKLDPSYPPEVEAIILRAMSVEPEARYESADAMRVALEAYLAKGSPVGADVVATLVKERAAQDLDARRERIRAATARSRLSSPPTGPAFTPSRPPPTASLPPPTASLPPLPPSIRPAPSIPPAPSMPPAAAVSLVPGAPAPPQSSKAAITAPRSSTSRLLIVGLVAGAVVCVGAGYTLAMRARGVAGREAAAAQAVDRSSSPGTAPSASSTLASGTGVNGADGRAAPATLVTFRIRPSNAVLVVDGVRLPEGVNAVQRPADGHALRIVVHADRYEDSVEVVEQSTPAVLDVVLTPRGGARSPKRPRTAPSADTEAAMPNPYE